MIQRLFLPFLLLWLVSPLSAGELSVQTEIDQAQGDPAREYLIVDVQGTLTVMDQQALALYQCVHLSTALEKKLSIYVKQESYNRGVQLFEIRDELKDRFDGRVELHGNIAILEFQANMKKELPERRLVFQVSDPKDFQAFLDRYGEKEGAKQLIYALLYVAMDVLDERSQSM